MNGDDDPTDVTYSMNGIGYNPSDNYIYGNSIDVDRPAPMDRGRGALLMTAGGEVRVATTSTGTLVTIERRLTIAPD